MESLTLQPIARVDGAINLPGSKVFQTVLCFWRL